MSRQIRDSRWDSFLNGFLEDDSLITSIALFKSEKERFEEYIKKNEIPVQIQEVTNIGSRKLRITLEKM